MISGLDDHARRLISSAHASNSRRSYATAVDRYLKFCNQFQLSPHQLDQQTILRFIAYLAQQQLMARTIKVYLAGIRAWLIVQGAPAPQIYTEAVKLALKSLDRRQPSPSQVAPITKDILMAIMISLPPTYDNFMYFTAMVVAYFACMRAAEYCYDPTVCAPLLTSAVSFTQGQIPYFTLSVPSSKNMAHGYKVVVGCTGSYVCAVCTLSHYLTLRPREPFSLLFQTADRRPLTYKLLSQFIKAVILKLGMDARTYTPHSIRAGAATDAAQAGLPTEAIKNLGRWRSDAYVQYLRPTANHLASLSAQLLNSSAPPSLHAAP